MAMKITLKLQHKIKRQKTDGHHRHDRDIFNWIFTWFNARCIFSVMFVVTVNYRKRVIKKLQNWSPQNSPSLLNSPSEDHISAWECSVLGLFVCHFIFKKWTQRFRTICSRPCAQDWAGSYSAGLDEMRYFVSLRRIDLPIGHNAFCTMGIGSFPGVKRSGRAVDHPPHLTQRSNKE